VDIAGLHGKIDVAMLLTSESPVAFIFSKSPAVTAWTETVRSANFRATSRRNHNFLETTVETITPVPAPRYSEAF